MYASGKVGPRGQYIENARISSLVAAFPINAPRYALHVLVDEPKPRADVSQYATAGVVAAPTARRVVERVAPILGMVPETERIAQIQQSIALPLTGRPRTATATAAPAPAPAPPRPPIASPAMLPRTPTPANLDAPAAPIRRTDARDGIAMPRLVLGPLHFPLQPMGKSSFLRHPEFRSTRTRSSARPSTMAVRTRARTPRRSSTWWATPTRSSRSRSTRTCSP